jgi:hypothetical protein
MISPPGLALAPGEVLVHHVSPDGEVELRVVPIAALVAEETIDTADATRSDAVRISGEVVSRIWIEVLRANGPDFPSPSPVHVPGAFDPAWLRELPLPVGTDRPATQPIALVDQHTSVSERHSFERSTDEQAIDDAYRREPRTRVYEDIGYSGDGWFSLAARQLVRLARCKVVCALYSSCADDLTMGEHHDMWQGVIIQFDGTKVWHTRADMASPPREITMRAGDMLLMPNGTWHEVSTPDHSTHMVFAIQTHEPISTQTADTR